MMSFFPQPWRAELRHAAVLLALCASTCFAQAPYPPAEELLSGCTAALPDIPLHIEGQLISRNADGDIEARRNVDMLLDWRAQPATAHYTIRDAFGKAMEHLSVTWPAEGAPEYRYLKGDPLVAAETPPLADALTGTDISWMDLSLSFFWWPGGRTVGAQEVKGRGCFIVDLPAPPDTFPGISGVRLWIDPKIPVMLRAEAYDAHEELIRRMDVKSFKKINGRWFIQNIEVETIASRHRTALKVRDVQDRERRSFMKEDAGPGETAPAAEDIDTLTPVPVE